MGTIGLQNLPLGLGSFQLDPSLDGGITKPIYNAVTGLFNTARLLTPKTAEKEERSTIEIVYEWDPGGAKKSYRLNFHDIEINNLLGLGVERFDVVGETRKSVQQTMGRLNKYTSSSLSLYKSEFITVSLVWNEVGDIIVGSGGVANYKSYVALLPDSTKPIDILQAFDIGGRTTASTLKSTSLPAESLPTKGPIALGNLVGWWLQPTPSGYDTTQLSLYVALDYTGGMADASTYRTYLTNTFTQYSYPSDVIPQDVKDVGSYEGTLYVDTWATAPDKIVIAGVCEMPQGYETTDTCQKYNSSGNVMSLNERNADTFPTEFFKALEMMYYLNSHPQCIRRGDRMYINDFARGQQIPVTFKSRRYPMGIERPFLANFELEFIALEPLSQAKETSDSGY